MTYLTVAQVAAETGRPERTIRDDLAAGRFAGAIKPGRDWLIPAAAVARFQAPRRGRPAGETSARKVAGNA